MLEIGIKGDRDKDGMKNILRSRFRELNMEMEEEILEDGFILWIRSDLKPEDFYGRLSKGIQTMIRDIYLDEIIIERVKQIYSGEKTIDDEEVINNIKAEIWSSYSYATEKEKISDELVKYLEDNKIINLEGYIRFRLYDYVYLVDVSIDQIMYIVEEEKKLDEFLDMMQYFVDSRDSSVKFLNLILRDDGFIFKDMDSKLIGKDIVNKVKKQFKGEKIGMADILLSSLIIMAPNRIVIHSKKNENQSLILTIEKIFTDKVVVCNGCNICKLDAEVE